MKRSCITVEEVMEIFRDFLDSLKDTEIIQTKKFGWMMIEDPGKPKDRSCMIMTLFGDGQELAKLLLASETYDVFYGITQGNIDPQDCDAITRQKIRESMLPRLDLLPKDLEKEVDDFFM